MSAHLPIVVTQIVSAGISGLLSVALIVIALVWVRKANVPASLLMTAAGALQLISLIASLGISMLDSHLLASTVDDIITVTSIRIGFGAVLNLIEWALLLAGIVVLAKSLRVQGPATNQSV